MDASSWLYKSRHFCWGVGQKKWTLLITPDSALNLYASPILFLRLLSSTNFIHFSLLGKLITPTLQQLSLTWMFVLIIYFILLPYLVFRLLSFLSSTVPSYHIFPLSLLSWFFNLNHISIHSPWWPLQQR